ncbi:MAG: LppX_LprAFG lipoprotein [Thermoleophilia bacterium]
MAKLLVVLVVVLVVVLPAVLPAGCSSGDDSSVDPVQTLKESAEAMKSLQSFHFTYEVNKPENSPKSQGLEIARIVGDVIADGNMRATIDLLQNDVPFQVAFVAVGATQYVQDPTSQKWQSTPAAFSPVGSLNLNKGTVQVLERIGDAKYVGTEDVGGMQTYHLSGTVQAAEVAAIAGSTTAEEPFEGEVWIGVEDHFVRRIVVSGPATANEVEGTVRTIELSAFDEPLEIVPPQ